MSKGLNSYRAIAFFAILLLHLGWFEPGYLGVQAFFVLSGFLITPILVDMKSRLNKKSFFTHFYGRRALRIFPLYYVYIAGISLIYMVFKLDNIPDMYHCYSQLPYTLSYTYNFYFATDYHGFSRACSHLWSLAVEEQFYIFWPFVIYFVSDKKLKPLLLWLIFLGPVWRFFIYFITKNQLLDFLHERWDIIIYVLPFSHIDAFAIGGFFALYRKKITMLKTSVIIVSALIVTLLSEIITAEKPAAYYAEFTHFMSDAYQFVWGYSLANFVFAVMLIQIREKAFFSALFENSILCYLGTISYGLYIFHFPIQSFLHGTLTSLPIIWVDIMILLSTLLISALSYELMEKRVVGLKDKYFSRSDLNR